MPTFLHSPLLWGLPIVAVPVLIHLINMLRHRRVEWAAMEFLLFSQKKHRTWIILKQLLLLLLRMLAVAAVVVMVAGPHLRDRWGRMLGGDRVHHIVLVDDSFSMSDKWGETTAFDEAKRAVQRIADAAVRRQEIQSFTLLRFSRAGQYGAGIQADCTKETVDTNFDHKLAELLKPIEASQTSAGPLEPLEAVTQLLGDDEGERRVVYLISDYRARQWEDPGELKERLVRLNDAGAEVHLIDCVDATRPNLGIVALKPDEGISAAATHWLMEVAVQNFGTTAVRNVPVLLTQDGQARPGLTIAEIPPGRVVRERFLVYFEQPGEHEIAARLEADGVLADNRRFAVVDLPAEMPALLIDGDPGARDATYLSLALAPGGRVRTGVRPRIEQPRFLSTHPLEEFRTITIVNVDRLDRSAVEALEKYVATGGGVAFFLGEQTRNKFINDELYRDGKGLFPAPITETKQLYVDRLEKVPDLNAEPHFIFRYLGDKPNEQLASVLVERYYGVAKEWKPQQSAAKIVMKLRNGAPLVVERSFGQGRVMAWLTTLGPAWNNWANNNETGSYPVVMRELQAYLAHRPAGDALHLVGTPLEVTLDAAEYQPQVRFITPADQTAPVATVDAVPNGSGRMTAILPSAGASGFYEARLTHTSGKPEVRRFAVNVDAHEGDLRAVFGPELSERLSPEVVYQFQPAATFESSLSEKGGYDLGQTLLYVLVVLLIGEQLLAWSAGYHPAPLGGSAAAGRWGSEHRPLSASHAAKEGDAR